MTITILSIFIWLHLISSQMHPTLEHSVHKLTFIASHDTLHPLISSLCQYPISKDILSSLIPTSRDILSLLIPYFFQYLVSFLPSILWYPASQDILHPLIPYFFYILSFPYPKLDYILPLISYLTLRCLFNAIPLRIFYLHTILPLIPYILKYIVLRYLTVWYPLPNILSLNNMPPTIPCLFQYPLSLSQYPTSQDTFLPPVCASQDTLLF